MLKIFETKNKKEHDNVMEHLNNWASQMYSSEYDRCMKVAKSRNENVVAIFDDWWHGKRVYTDEYRLKYSKDDYDNASGIILETVSNGFG
ncbi:hypothetical protein CIL05_07430 [Virgibacillus profundi]|uniref:Uncharacterized protein n=1 Tax=Virgibacillus profundi TaxID=2024555 RepID=A0A2A2IFG4_9BACI|nr:hypothetical protein [Virgibacillus profundi]PAV30292.1 hypothetical protein CIL05_07430 [Virgibacillus profundi]PXY54464.1 hypothetical protein CIT14_07515 [Virgibacillus profundi]